MLRKNSSKELWILDWISKSWRPLSSGRIRLDEQLQPFQALLEEFLEAQGLSPNCGIPECQQICLHVLQHLYVCMGDPDKAVFPYLIEGVSIGTDTPILPSNCFPKQDPPEDYQPPLLTVHHTDWMSAEESPEIVQELIDKEVASGWVNQF